MPGAPGLPRTDDLTPPPERLQRRLAGSARLLARRVYRVEVLDEQHFPTSGPVVVAATHTGFADGPLMTLFAPRPLHALTKVEMFVPPTGGLLRRAGLIPLTRATVDVRAVRLSLRVLADGGVVGIFPEGTRGAGDVLHAHGGAAYLALVSGAPVLPLVFLGTRRPGSAATWPARGSRIVMRYGEPVGVPQRPWPRRRADVAEVTGLVQQALVELRARALADSGLPAPGPLPPH